MSFRFISFIGNKERMGRREGIILGYGHFQTSGRFWFMQESSSTGRLLVGDTGQLQTSAIIKVGQKKKKNSPRLAHFFLICDIFSI